ncbi:MAG TPA: adenylosuccinate lyase [Thermoplasmataceae archaeon]|nr:adenylosuccinate lyase [Thermoplasmatales archaeon AK]HLH86026.1 adenylosuccinate lyase [Thermoplasmataceae archaeon]
MIISPLDYRYGRTEVKEIFSEERRLRYMLEVEAAIAQAEAEFNLIPREAFKSIRDAVDSGRIKPERVREIEKETKHDVMALVKALSEQAGSGGAYVHFGITSNDVLDTATALQLRDFYPVLMKDIQDLQEAFIRHVSEHKNTPMLGRTHGQHASPITFGLKMAVYLSEVNRHLVRVKQCRRRILVGKVMGPVGTGASLGDAALEIQDRVMEILSIFPERASSQIVNRDRYVEFLSVIAGIATSLEKFSTEIRNLQRPEIGEVQEFFDQQNQVGSSAMPSKMNPISSENVTSIARFIRSFVTPEQEAAVTWHERDLTNSALERFVIPYACVLIDYVLVRFREVLDKLIVHKDVMLSNLLRDDYVLSERIVTELTERGMGRQESHEFVRKSAMEGYARGITLRESMIQHGILKKISKEELDLIMDPRRFLGQSSRVCDMAVEESRRARIYAFGGESSEF